MIKHQAGRESILSARSDQPLIGLVLQEDGQEIARYFADEALANAALPPNSAEDALRVIGAWSDLDWDEMAEALERIRRESVPTLPIEL